MIESVLPNTDEYWHCRRHAVLFDVSERGKIEVTGKEAAFFLHNLCTNDTKNLAPGLGCEAFFTTAKAKVIAYAQIYREPNATVDTFWLDVDSPSVAKKLFEHLDHHLISEQVEFRDRTADFGQYHLAGPDATAVLGKIAQDGMPELKDHQHLMRTIASVHCPIRRHDPLGLPGYDVLCPRADAESVRHALIQAGARPAEAKVYDILRIEAGMPVFGQDIDEERAVMEVGRTKQAISYTKGCFLGQEPIVMARDRGHANRTLLGVRFSGNPLAAETAKLLRDGQEVGLVTSNAWSPRLNAWIGLAYIRRGHQEPGTRLEQAAGGTAEVVSLPFSMPDSGALA